MSKPWFRVSLDPHDEQNHRYDCYHGCYPDREDRGCDCGAYRKLLNSQPTFFKAETADHGTTPHELWHPTAPVIR